MTNTALGGTIDNLGAALALASPTRPLRDRMIAMTAVHYPGYFDESGTNNSSPYLVIAGYVSTYESWQRFEREWREDLLEWKGIEYFHMHDFMCGQKEYRGMQYAERRDIERRAFGIMKRRIEQGFYGVINKAAYKKWMDYPIVKSQFGTAYASCMRMCLVSVASWVKRFNLDAVVDYALEDGAKHTPETIQLFRKIREETDAERTYSLGSFVPVPKRSTLAVQSADPLAYLQRRRFSGELRPNERPTLDHLLEAVPTSQTAVFEEAHLKELVRRWLERNPPVYRKRVLDRSPFLKEAFSDLYSG